MNDLNGERQRFVLIDGTIWTCAWCAAGITNGIMHHAPNCRFIADITARTAP